MAIPKSARSVLHELRATPETVHWGFFDRSLRPVLAVASGDIVQIETMTHRAGDVPDLLMDEGVRAVFEQVTDRGPGGHILTGPIAVEEAEPGDTLEVRLLAIRPRLLYGSNFAGSWGLLHDELPRQRVTIYRFDADLALAHAVFAYEYPDAARVPGRIVEPQAVQRVAALENVVVPLRPHLGTAGVAPSVPGRLSSIPPAEWGGNIDNWRIGAGATMYYPVFVPGALLSAGDPHMAQGDGEISGTAIEASLDVTLQLVVRKDFPVHNPILETPAHWVTHGYDEDLNKAVHLAALEMLDFLVQHKGLSREDAYSLMSVAADFTVSQVVNRTQGIHAAIPKAVFVPPRG
jgi:acetamidase/formamidase